MNDTCGCEVIAIDGGAAAGKSSTARALAEQLNFMHVDTGAHYRTLTAALLQLGATPKQTAEITAHLKHLNLGTELCGQSALLSINNKTPSDKSIRSAKVNASVSLFAALPDIRKFLFDYQRGQLLVAEKYGYKGVIMEGRDIGTTIFPDAKFRFFLEADASTRAARRSKQGANDSITNRDTQDRTRKTAPLICAEGAIRIDTSKISLKDVIERILTIINVKQDD